ncbi:hypothetical protein JR316_0007249 [Psilocybe cubensis]|uniref:ABM domain-containing protein n=2 Tax=Psilocybe cubensis TaxID=181762 RepID=A0A8H7XSL1_PSICU|nr:hypothetical protein JR316_0007249 [Psilocybe cubensis]KAH9480649.1 hypothetical protein JR316_0007249 [Psilocybe cubensis]
MPVVEIVKVSASEAYKADPSILNPVAKFLSYSGLAEEDGVTLYLLVVWETLEHHRALQRRPGYPQIVGLGPAIDGELQMHHVEFNKDISSALNAPVTEIVRLALKPGVQTATKERLYELLKDGGEKIDAKNTHVPAIWGQSTEDTQVFWFLCGWDSVKVHTDIIHGDLANFAPFIGGINEIGDTTVLHAKLLKHSTD